MIHQDTIRLLRECDAGIKMGVDSIDQLHSYAKSAELKDALSRCRTKHEKLKAELNEALDRFGDEGKSPNPVVEGMSKLKTNFKLGLDMSDSTIADLITDGCNMGIKSLSRYLNQYKAADEKAKDITKKLISQEQDLLGQMRAFL